MRLVCLTLASIGILGGGGLLRGDSIVYLQDVPDYSWHAGCFGTATGNLMGYWDRHGFPDMYTGPTGNGVAPLDSRVASGNEGIVSLWASEAGVDGRPMNQPGHINDYWRDAGYVFSGFYESPEPDPYLMAGRPEHEPDCIGDFIGLSQNKWTNMAGECDGNINAYSFVYWDKTGGRRTNFTPPADAGGPPEDIQSGLRAWTHWRGYEGDVFTQLADFNPECPPGAGFTYEDAKAEIDAGYPFMVFLQPHNEMSRDIPPMSRANPPIHGMLVYGYFELDGTQWVYYRTSWGDKNSCGAEPCKYSRWTAEDWTTARIPVRGVIGFRPHPKVTSIVRGGGQVTLKWDGPASLVYNALTGGKTLPHEYRVERSSSLSEPMWTVVGGPTKNRILSVPDSPGETAFFRVVLAE